MLLAVYISPLEEYLFDLLSIFWLSCRFCAPCCCESWPYLLIPHHCNLGQWALLIGPYFIGLGMEDMSTQVCCEHLCQSQVVWLQMLCYAASHGFPAIKKITPRWKQTNASVQLTSEGAQTAVSPVAGVLRDPQASPAHSALWRSWLTFQVSSSYAHHAIWSPLVILEGIGSPGSLGE